MSNKCDRLVKRVSVLGATGSIGINTLDMIGRNSERYEVIALTANRNVDKLAELALKHKARYVAIADESLYGELKSRLSAYDIQVGAGAAAVNEAASIETDWVMSAIVGAAGLRPTMTAIRQGYDIALANKECLVCAGDLMMDEVAAHNVRLLPVDSEHNAIFQVFDFEQIKSVERIILTASGGPFYKTPLEQMSSITPEQAVAHPNWDMGAKISVDSATLMNKGLELIEAYHLFPVNKDQLDAVIHPQSVVHSMVEYCDGSVLAQMGAPDMRIPIAYALEYPKRINTPAKKLNFSEIGSLDFYEPDFERFPALKLALDALKVGGNAPTILNAANEAAVYAFLAHKIGYFDIIKVVDYCLNHIAYNELKHLNDVYILNDECRRIAENFIKKIS